MDHPVFGSSNLDMDRDPKSSFRCRAFTRTSGVLMASPWRAPAQGFPRYCFMWAERAA